MSGFINQLLDNIPDDELQQIKALRRVADIARNLWKTEPGSPDLDLLAEKAGDAARVEANRTPLGESGLLEFFCSVVQTQGLRSTLIIQCLRIIGNSSADQDENRARVVASGCLPSIISLLDDDSVLAFVIPVLFNISVDYDPAIKAIYQAGINPALIGLLSGARLDDAPVLVNYACKLLSQVATQEPEANLVHPDTSFVLLSVADKLLLPLDAEEFFNRIYLASTYLAPEQAQQAFLETPGALDLILRTFSAAAKNLGSVEEYAGDDPAPLDQVFDAFTAILADLSARPLFASLCPLDRPEVATLQSWLSSPENPLPEAACLMLGNLARSDEKCGYLVQKLAVHKPLVAILADPTRDYAKLLHSVLSFLKNLAILPENKPTLGDAGLFEAGVLPRIWDLDKETQVQFDAVSLTRLLLVNCPANVGRICAPLAECTLSRSKLHLLIDLNARSTQEPTQMETARAITTVCRVLHSTPTSSPSAQDQPLPSPEAFYAAHSTLTDAMLRLGLQSKFHVLKSELLFALALMARSPAGAAVIARSCTHRPEFAAMLVEVVTGEKPTTPSSSTNDPDPSTSISPPPDLDLSLVSGLEAQAPTPSTQAQNAMRTVDRENALVLVAQLLQSCADDLPTDLKQTFQDLLREGGQLVLRERDAATASSSTTAPAT
ncbi:armadillo-type protein [Nemania diffusa]|nr:armadillo-type protein [Nemania diffusa]